MWNTYCFSTSKIVKPKLINITLYVHFLSWCIFKSWIMDKDQKLKCIKRNTYRKLAVHLREVRKREIRTQNEGSVLKINSFLTRDSQLLLKTIKAVEKLFLLRRRYFKTESSLRWLVAGLSPRRPYFDPRKSTWDLWWQSCTEIGQNFLWALRSSLVSIVPPVPHTNSFILLSMTDDIWAIVMVV